MELTVESPTSLDPSLLLDLQLRRMLKIRHPSRARDEFAEMDTAVGRAKWRLIDHTGHLRVHLEGEVYVHVLLQPSCFLPFSGIDVRDPLLRDKNSSALISSSTTCPLALARTAA